MPNIASVLKEEIVRLARKEGRGQTEKLKQESVRHRKEIVALKRQVAALERQVQRLGKAAGRAAAAPQAEEEAGPHLRFSASGFAAKRKRLGLSAAEAAALLGVSAQSVYKWEHGGARPRASQLAAIATLRKMGKREAQAKLEALAQ